MRYNNNALLIRVFQTQRTRMKLRYLILTSFALSFTGCQNKSKLIQSQEVINKRNTQLQNPQSHSSKTTQVQKTKQCARRFLALSESLEDTFATNVKLKNRGIIQELKQLSTLPDQYFLDKFKDKDGEDLLKEIENAKDEKGQKFSTNTKNQMVLAAMLSTASLKKEISANKEDKSLKNALTGSGLIVGGLASMLITPALGASIGNKLVSKIWVRPPDALLKSVTQSNMGSSDLRSKIIAGTSTLGAIVGLGLSIIAVVAGISILNGESGIKTEESLKKEINKSELTSKLSSQGYSLIGDETSLEKKLNAEINTISSCFVNKLMPMN